MIRRDRMEGRIRGKRTERERRGRMRKVTATTAKSNEE